ncbi:5627_t:CDS:1, partial [Racocetra persica]
IRIPHKYFLYLHLTQETYYAANKLDLRSAVYLMEFITFPLIANDRKDLTILQDWVTKDA